MAKYDSNTERLGSQAMWPYSEWQEPTPTNTRELAQCVRHTASYTSYPLTNSTKFVWKPCTA